MTVQNPKPREPPNRKSKEEQRREIMQINRILNMPRHTTADLIENQAYAVPSWEKEPDPLDGWTLEDQRLLIAADKELRKNRLAMLDLGLPEEKVLWEHLRQIARRVPGKSVVECCRCFKYIERTRIAYFGRQSSSFSADDSCHSARRHGADLV